MATYPKAHFCFYADDLGTWPNMALEQVVKRIFIVLYRYIRSGKVPVEMPYAYCCARDVRSYQEGALFERRDKQFHHRFYFIVIYTAVCMSVCLSVCCLSCCLCMRIVHSTDQAPPKCTMHCVSTANTLRNRPHDTLRFMTFRVLWHCVMRRRFARAACAWQLDGRNASSAGGCRTNRGAGRPTSQAQAHSAGTQTMGIW